MAAATKKENLTTTPKTETSKRHLVAVYGTLKKGFGNHVLIEQEGTHKFKGSVLIPGFMMVSCGGFPAVVKMAEDFSGMINAQVWEVNENTLRLLDQLEGHPDWYTRILVPCAYGEAWLYTFPESALDKYPVVPNGNWSK